MRTEARYRLQTRFNLWILVPFTGLFSVTACLGHAVLPCIAACHGHPETAPRAAWFSPTTTGGSWAWSSRPTWLSHCGSAAGTPG